MACRDESRSQKPFNEVSAAATGEVELRTLDLADLDSVAEFAAGMNADSDSLDILVNNAGVMGGRGVLRHKVLSNRWEPTTWATLPSPRNCGRC